MALEFRLVQWSGREIYLCQSLRISISCRWSSRKVESDNLSYPSAPPPTDHCLALLSRGTTRSSCSGTVDCPVSRSLRMWPALAVLGLERLAAPLGIVEKTSLYTPLGRRAPGAAKAPRMAFRWRGHRAESCHKDRCRE